MFVIIALAVLSTLVVVNGNETDKDGFKKISVHDICFQGRNNQFGQMYSYLYSGLIGAIKLRYKSGEIRCASNVAYNSRWGCGHHPSLNSHPLNVVVTDMHNHVIYPRKENIANSGMWYWLPFFDHANSDKIVFTDFGRPFFLPRYGALRIWYGEDLKNWHDSDNQGRVCVDVWAKFV